MSDLIADDYTPLLNTSELRGPGKIFEQVTTEGGGGFSRRTRLCDQWTGVYITEKWSDAATEQVAFDGLAMGRPYVLYCLDETDADGAEYQAVAISWRYPTPDGSRPE